MLVRSPLSKEELSICVDMYIKQNDYSFMDADPEVGLKNLFLHWKTGEFIKVLEDKGKVVGWICASMATNYHTTKPFLNQQYYTSILTGFSAAKAVYLLHDELIKEGRKKKLNLVMSCGSHMDPDHTFTKILERRGWLRRGHVAIYKL
jgi:hypothetical protein